MKSHIFCLIIILAAIGGTYHFCIKKMSPDHISPQRCGLRTNMRKLWSDHVWWTRDYLISAIANMPDLKVATNRLLKNQDDIGAAIVPFYGQAAGEALAKLLKEHIMIAAQVVTAAKAGNDDALTAANVKWHANADEIALFLSNANPYWPYKDMQNMMYEHLKLTTDEAVARLHQDWQADVEAFEKVFHEIMMMADGLTAGIAKQFPDKC